MASKCKDKVADSSSNTSSVQDRRSQLVAEECAAYLAEHGPSGLLPFPSSDVSAAIATRADVKVTQVEKYVVRHLRDKILGEDTQPDGGKNHIRRHLYVMLHKPAGYSSMRTPGATVYALLAKMGFPPLPHVGRLDKQTQGLLLLTDDGTLANALADGSEEGGGEEEVVEKDDDDDHVGGNAGTKTKVSKIYRSLVDVPEANVVTSSELHLEHPRLTLTPEAIEGLCRPLEYEPGRFTTAAQHVKVVQDAPVDLSNLKGKKDANSFGKVPPEEEGVSASAGVTEKMEESAPTTAVENGEAKPKRQRRHVLMWVELTITEGKKHQVRKLFGRAGMRVKQLVRTSFGGLTLGDLALGSARSLTNPEVADCYRVTGLSSRSAVPQVWDLAPTADHRTAAETAGGD